jgi:hypothetical protein
VREAGLAAGVVGGACVDEGVVAEDGSFGAFAEEEGESVGEDFGGDVGGEIFLDGRGVLGVEGCGCAGEKGDAKKAEASRHAVRTSGV